MAAVTWEDKPIQVMKDQAAVVIVAGTGYERCTWQKPRFPGFIIDGNGWEAISGCKVRYSLRVSVLYSSGTADDNYDVAEEMCRRVYSALALANFGFDRTPPVGLFEVFGQKFAGAQITAYTQLTLLEGF